MENMCDKGRECDTLAAKATHQWQQQKKCLPELWELQRKEMEEKKESH